MRTKSLLTVALLSLSAVGHLCSPNSAAADPAVSSVNPVMVLDASLKPTAIQVGASTLVRDDTGVSFTMTTSKLTPLDIYTIWWVISKPGSEPFLILRATGGIALPDGTATFGGRLPVGRVPAADGKTVLANTAPGGMFDQSRGVKVELFVHGHGPVVLSALTDQLTTYLGGCPPNTCVTTQMAAHAP